MISCSVEISIGAGVVALVRGLSVCRFFLFFIFYFLYHEFLVKLQELACSGSYSVKKTIIPNTPPLHLVMGKIKNHKSIGKISLA